jgi:4-oxalocrotonate tautomerase family enzyme
MPRVEINMVEGDHSVSQKLAFMKKATEAVVRILHCPPEDVRVTILEYKRENASRAGVSVLESG